MTKEEYIKHFNSSEIGLCEICINFNTCVKNKTLKENGCDNIETDRYNE